MRPLLAQHPELAAQLTPSGARQLAHAARNNDLEAARLMLEAGLPVDTHTQHHATPLHWASWHGNTELVRLILLRKPPLDRSQQRITKARPSIGPFTDRRTVGVCRIATMPPRSKRCSRPALPSRGSSAERTQFSRQSPAAPGKSKSSDARLT